MRDLMPEIELKLTWKDARNPEGLSKDDLCLLAFSDGERIYLGALANWHGSFWYDAGGDYSFTYNPVYYAKLPHFLK